MYIYICIRVYIYIFMEIDLLIYRENSHIARVFRVMGMGFGGMKAYGFLKRGHAPRDIWRGRQDRPYPGF